MLQYMLGIKAVGLATFVEIYELLALNYSWSLSVSERLLDVSFRKALGNFHLDE